VVIEAGARREDWQLAVEHGPTPGGTRQFSGGPPVRKRCGEAVDTRPAALLSGDHVRKRRFHSQRAARGARALGFGVGARNGSGARDFVAARKCHLQSGAGVWFCEVGRERQASLERRRWWRDEEAEDKLGLYSS